MMPACPDRILVLGALVDGELDAANTALAEAHAARCEGCRAEIERLQAVRTLLRGPGVRHTAPATLRRRAGALPGMRAEPSAAKFLPGWLAPGVAGALAASLALVMFVPQDRSGMDRQLVSSHVRSLQPGHLTDVQTSDQHVVKPWFNGRIDFSPPVPELAPDGFPLVGGRLDAADGKTVAAIVYKRRLHIVNLFVWPAADARARAAVEEEGFAVREWSAGGLRFAAVSDIAPQELSRFEAIFRDRTR